MSQRLRSMEPRAKDRCWRRGEIFQKPQHNARPCVAKQTCLSIVAHVELACDERSRGRYTDCNGDEPTLNVHGRSYLPIVART